MGFDAGAAIGRLELGLEGWKKSVEAVKKDQESLAGFAMRHKDEIQKLGREMTIAGGAIVGAFGLMVKSAADYGDNMDELAQRTGAGVDILTGLEGALKKNGSSVEDLGMGIKTLAGKMVDANNGNKEASALFESLGIKVADANGKLRSTTDVLFDISDRFAGAEDGAAKTAIAVDLLGKGGLSLIPTLNLGAKGLREEADEAQRLGRVLTKEAAKAASDFNDELQDLKSASSGVTMEIGRMLMPVVKDITEMAKEAAVKFREWAKEHPGLAEGLVKVAAGAGGLMMVLGPLLIALPTLVTQFAKLKLILESAAFAKFAVFAGELAGIAFAAKLTADEIKRMNDHLDMVELDRGEKIGWVRRAYEDINAAVLKVMGGIDTAKIAAKAFHAELIDTGIPAARTLAKAITDLGTSKEKAGASTVKYADRLINTLVPALRQMAGTQMFVTDTLDEFGETIIGLANTEIPAARDAWKAFNYEAATETETMATQVSSRWDDLLRDITSGWGESLQGMIEGTSSFKDFLDETWEAIKTAFFRLVADMVVEWISNGVKSLIGGAAEAGASIAKNIGEGVSNVAAGVSGISSVLSGAGAIGSIISGITGIIGLLGPAKQQTDVTYWLKLIKDNGQILTDHFVVFYNWALGELWPVAYTARDMIGDIKGIVSGIQSTLWSMESWAAKTFDAISKLPHAAGGAIFSSPALVHVAESGPEAIIPHNQLGAWLASQPAGGAANVSVNVNLYAPLVQTSGVADTDLERAGEKLMKIIERQFRRSGLRLKNA